MPSKYNFTDVTLTIGYYSILIVSSIGFLSNFLNILVCMRKRMRKTAMGFCNIIISTFNFAYLVLALFQNNYLTSSEYSCILLPYFTRVIYQMSSWLNVLVLLDRMILISYKNRSDDVFNVNMEKVSLIIMALFALICIVNLPNIFFSLQTQTYFNPLTNTTVMYTMCTSDTQTILIRDILAAVSRVVLPLVLEVIINTTLILKLIKFKNLTTTISHYKEFRFAQTIIILNVFYGVSNLISVITIVFINIYGYNQTYISTTTDQSAIASFAYVCASIFGAFINCDLIFFVNMVTNKRFREEASQVLDRRIYPN